MNKKKQTKLHKFFDNMLEYCKKNEPDIFYELNHCNRFFKNEYALMYIVLLVAILWELGIIALLALPAMLIWNFLAGIFHFGTITYVISLIGIFVFDLINKLYINPIWVFNDIDKDGEKNDEV